VRLFGMTRMRLMVSLFILLLAFCFVLLLIQMFRGRFAYMKALLAAGCALVLAMSFADIDRVVLKYNMWAHRTGRLEALDVNALRELGDAKVPHLIALSYAEDEAIRVEALDQLHAWREGREFAAERFTRYNYTQRRAEQAFEAYYAREDCPLPGFQERFKPSIINR